MSLAAMNNISQLNNIIKGIKSELNKFSNKYTIDTTFYFPNDGELVSDWIKRVESIDSNKANELNKLANSKGIGNLYTQDVTFDRLYGNKVFKDRFEKENKDKISSLVSYVDKTSDEINKLKKEYDVTSNEQKRYELSTMINSLYDEINKTGINNIFKADNNILLNNSKVSNKLYDIDNYIKNVNVDNDKKALDDYNARQEEQKKFEEEKAKKEEEERLRQEEEAKKQPTINPTVEPETPKVDEWGKPVVEGNVNPEDERAKALEELNNGLRNGLSNISISMGNDGNPVINGRVGYTYDDAKLGIEDLKNVINERLNEALIPFLQSSSFTTRQKIDALETFFMNNPNYTNADLYNIVKFKDNLFNDINTIVSSNISDDEKISRMNDLATQYEMWVGANKNIFPFKLSDMWNDFQIDKDLTSRGLLKLAVDTTVDGQELSKALDMYLSNKSIYDDAIKNYENMVNSYTPDKLESLGQEYGDIASKYNAQKVDKQITNTATGLGQGGAIATQLGNEAQYQNYAENLAENQMAQTDNVTNYAQNKLDNEYAKVQNAYNNAMQAENAVMGEVDKNQADINAYLTKKGVDLATDKYNYERKMQPVQVATNVASSAANAVDKIKNN